MNETTHKSIQFFTDNIKVYECNTFMNHTTKECKKLCCTRKIINIIQIKLNKPKYIFIIRPRKANSQSLYIFNHDIHKKYNFNYRLTLLIL